MEMSTRTVQKEECAPSQVEIYSTDDESTGQKKPFPCKDKELFADFDWEKLTSKIRSDSMFELRKLACQHRPVSEFASKLTLEQHFANRPQPTDSQPPRQPAAPLGNAAAEASETVENSAQIDEEGSLNVSARVRQLEPSGEEAETRRPEEIEQDMQALQDLRVVHGILQGPVHEEIDQALREGMERLNSRQRPRVPPRARRIEGGEEGGDEMNPAPVGRLLGRSRRQRGRRVRFRPQIPTPNADGRYPVPCRDQSRIMESLRRSPALNSLGVEARDEIVAEVGGLVSQHLVTSALAGNFRGTLELLIQSRVDEMEGQGGPGRGLHRQLPRHNPQDREENDGRESPAASGASVRELREEMVIMKGQLNELKQMMRVSFDLQLDIQRAIRQEVAAALSAFLSPQGPSLAASAGPPPPCPVPTLGGATSTRASGVSASASSTKVVEAGHCVICSEGVIDSVMYHCGHMCTCTACGLELKSKALKCPICRAPITDVIRTYASML